MSLNVRTIQLGQTEVTLRLTSKAIFNYAQKHGAKESSPLVAILAALDDIGARMDLLTGALQHPENKNTVKDGGALLDLLADNSYDRCAVNQLILDLTMDAGLISGEDYSALLEPVAENGNRLISTLADVLAGKKVSAGGAEQPETNDKNPT